MYSNNVTVKKILSVNNLTDNGVAECVSNDR